MPPTRTALLFLAVLPFLVIQTCAYTAAPTNVSSGSTPHASTSPESSTPVRAIHEDAFVTIGGIEQWITIRGANRNNPIVLFLHGGPGNPLTPYADSIYGAWASEFTLVQWDQRGAGKTYARNPPAEGSTLTVKQMTEDGVAVAEYVAHHLGQKQVILLGGSWGSVLGVHMIKARPDLFEAYVGASQIVGKVENESASYARIAELARAVGDATTVAALKKIGAPPWKNPRSFGILRRASRVYEAKTCIPAPESWWTPAPEYATAPMREAYEAGEDYSFVQFVGMNDDGMFATVDLPKLGSDFAVPIYLVQGADDLITLREVTQRYFETIHAPRKKFIVVPKAGHDPNEAMLAAEHSALVDCCTSPRRR
jgi:pimeloyl-ACP methyl ester carboxylesterase